MAPKRKVAAPKSVSVKQAKKGSTQKQKEPLKTPEEINMEIVCEALANEEYPIGGPPSNRKLLLDAVPFAFAEFVEERHKFQADMVACMQEAFDAIRESLCAEVVKQEEVQASAETTRTHLANQQETAQSKLDEAIIDLDVKTEAAREKKDALKEAGDAVKEAEKDENTISEELDELNDRREELRMAEEELYSPMREAVANKVALKKLEKILVTMNLDSSLCKVLPDALGKVVEDRGMFDKMATDYLEKQFQEQRVAVEDSIIATTETLEGKKAITQEREQLRDVACEAKKEADDAKSESTNAKKKAAGELKDCQKAVKTHEEDVEEAVGRKIEAEEEVATFQKILEAFVALRDRSSLPPAVVEEVVEPVVEVAMETATEEMSDVQAVIVDEQVEVAEITSKVSEVPVDDMRVEVGM